MSNSRSQSRKKETRGKGNPAPLAKPAGAGEGLLDRYLVLLLFLALVSLTLLSAETPLLVCLLGLVLCVAGIAQGPVKIDLWVLIPLVAYQVFSIISSYLVYHTIYGNMATGFASTQGIYPVIYLLMAYLPDRQQLLLRRLCVWWAGFTAATGLLYFAVRAQAEYATRLGFIFGNPNSFGIFLAASWFALQFCHPKEDGSPWARRMVHLEPLVLAALALTLSMGTFVAMAAGILVLAIPKLRREPLRDVARFTCNLLARAAFGFGIGILMYVAARRTGAPWLCIPLLVYALAVSYFWDRFLAFLDDFPMLAAAAAAMGILVAAAAIAIRPSAVDTFAERLAMMRNGVGYFTERPLCGLGPYQWRIWNLYDSDIYYNTYHIHNTLIHIGVELGLPAMAMAVVVLIRCFWKRDAADCTAGLAAFAVHNLIDPSFFNIGITVLVMESMAAPAKKGTQIPAFAARLVFAAFAVMFAGGLLDGARYL